MKSCYRHAVRNRGIGGSHPCFGQALQRAASVYGHVGHVEVDLESRDVKRGDTVEHLTSKESKLLYCLISHRGEIVSHRRLFQAVWGQTVEMKWHTCAYLSTNFAER